jgi:hypothetical protein
MTWIPDYWDWEYARALEAFDGDEKLARLEDNFRIPDSSSASNWSSQIRLSASIRGARGLCERRWVPPNGGPLVRERRAS